MSNREMAERFAKAQEQMISRDLKGRGITDANVLRVMREIQRQKFVLESYQSQAYADGPLPIGCGQTISQPYIVALMTQELRLNSDCEVLEIGTGSGYQTAVLSRLAKKVYTIERFAQLSELAQAVLGRLGISNVEFYIGDGSCGWPKQRWDPVLQRSAKWEPCFDRIIFTATAPKVPEPLEQQLGEGGLMAGPVGYGGAQELMVFEKRVGKITEKVICDVRFVKLVGEYGFEEV